MFTGIIEELGSIEAMTDLGDAARIAVRGSAVAADAGHGDSISVNGVCLTVVENDGDVFTADVMKETLDRSSLGDLVVGDRVNLERAAMLSTRLGGHLVQGHVDGASKVRGREPASEWEVLSFDLPPALSKYVVEKGSITVDGVSLTVMAVDDESFSVGLIPTTLKITVLGSKAVGDPVNLEVDVIAKYVEKMLGARHV